MQAALSHSLIAKWKTFGHFCAMNPERFGAVLFLLLLSISIAVASPQTETIGLDLLRATDPSLTGNGVRVAQPEAPVSSTDWQVNPSSVGQPVSLFTYYSSGGSSTAFPNGLGSESGHANGVGMNFYGSTNGTAPGVAHVDNYEANYFYQSVVTPGLPIPAKIVNQSFVFGNNPPQTTADTQYDNYAAQNNTLFVSGVGNSGAPMAPSTSYNGIGVGAFGGASAVGPTTDNGRSKPDITAPGEATSFSTPYVAGSAAILVQAGARGDGGAGTASASADIRTLKALLLNGAVKPAGWTHTTTAPLDTRYGAGILNVFNSHRQLAAGKKAFVESTTVSSGGAHPPGSNSGNLDGVGWDFNTIASTITQDRVNHYYFNFPAGGGSNYSVTATLVWNRPAAQSSANNLDLFLYDTSNGSVVASSVSAVDNVEHLHVTNLVAGRYDLQVLKRGGLGNMGTETYAIAFELIAVPLTITRTGNVVNLAWPIYPAGYHLQSAPDLNPPASWSNVTTPPVITNNQNRVTVPASASSQYFRLVRP